MFKVDELLKATAGRLISGRLDQEIKGVSIDSRTLKPQECFIAIRGSNFDGHNFIDAAVKKGASCIIKEKRTNEHPACRQAGTNKRTNLSIIEVKDTIKALGDMARFQRDKFDIPLIAVTGSNGKTTTKEMLTWVLSQKFKVLKNEGTKNNQIGLPLTLLKLDPSYNVVILELGTNHFGEIDYLSKICKPNIGIINNIGPAHLEYLHNLKGIFYEKYALIEGLKRPCLAILNSDDSLLRRQVYKKIKRPFILSFGIKNKSDFSASEIKILNDRIEFLVNRRKQKYKFILKIPGYYNIYNALVTITVARIFGWEYPDIARRLVTFKPLPGRLNFVSLNNIKFIDDTYNSNPLSLKQALDTLANFRAKGRKIFIMGDMLELGRDEKLLHTQVAQRVKRICDIFITVGRLSKFAAKKAVSLGFEIKNIFTCESTAQAHYILFEQLSVTPDDIVLIKGSRAMRMEELLGG